MSESGRYASAFRPGLFDDKIVLVTGGGTGIGRCTAHELAALGATVIIAGRRAEVLEVTAAEIHADGGRCEVAPFDIRESDAVDARIAEIVARHGRIDGLVNNAGGQFAKPLEDVSPNGWKTVVDLNLNGTFNVTHAAFRHSLQEHGGSIVMMLADIQAGYPWMAHMSAARAGIENLCRTITLEWGHYGIRANCVAPGTILSSGMLTYPEAVQKSGARAGETVPAMRLGTESEVSATIAFLLSPAAGYISGVTIAIDGGSALQKSRLMRLPKHPGWERFNGFHRAADFSGTPYENC
jgi:citronellol/citronellal dehydrogenase